MDALKNLLSFHCELKIMSAKNIQVTSSNEYLFVRCYLYAGQNKRVRFDSREISKNGKLSWNEAFSLDCVGNNKSIDMITNKKIVLEIRSRSNSTVTNLLGGSRLIGRADVSWSDVLESKNMEIEKWVTMKSKKKDVKAPCVRIAMKIEVPHSVGSVVRKKTSKLEDSCGCCYGDCCNSTCVDSEFFVIGAALDAF
ncbi:uncharacterized protein [Rutidosis leptorrhynchoides]|uniref:uncharacterized protein n=1 Tax=Rutidosis leptorrhynchoides TaxID=125765 RepID=UPI003A990AA7